MRDVGGTREEFVNHEPQASGLRILRDRIESKHSLLY